MLEAAGAGVGMMGQSVMERRCWDRSRWHDRRHCGGYVCVAFLLSVMHSKGRAGGIESGRRGSRRLVVVVVGIAKAKADAVVRAAMVSLG